MTVDMSRINMNQQNLTHSRSKPRHITTAALAAKTIKAAEPFHDCPESVVEVCKNQISRRVNGTAQRSIEVTALDVGDVVVRVCLAVSNGTLHFWLYLPRV